MIIQNNTPKPDYKRKRFEDCQFSEVFLPLNGGSKDLYMRIQYFRLDDGTAYNAIDLETSRFALFEGNPVVYEVTGSYEYTLIRKE